MRADLNKQLCEHERYSSKDHYKNYRNLKKFNSRTGNECENLPVRESMKIRYGWNRKTFSENLNPLYGAIRKAVGRSWNKFYSELCQIFDKRSVINQHILQHLYDYIEVKTYIGDDGEIWYRRNYRGDEQIKTSGTEFFVDPRDGIIKRNKWYRTWRAASKEAAKKREIEQAKVFRKIDEYHVLRLVDGIWFEYELKQIPRGRLVYEKPFGKDVFKSAYNDKEKTWEQLTEFERQRFGVPRHVGGRAFDIFTGDTVYLDGNTVYGKRLNSKNEMHRYDGNLYHASKKTASHKVLKKAGIV